MTSIEYTAAFFGVLGTLLLALNGKRAGWGFVAFLASNAGWIAFAIANDHRGLLVQQLAFTATSFVGIWRWLVVPRVALRVAAAAPGPNPLYIAGKTALIDLMQVAREAGKDAAWRRARNDRIVEAMRAGSPAPNEMSYWGDAA